MDVSPQRAAGETDWGWSWLERILFGLVAVAVGVGTLWLAFLMLLVLGRPLDCVGSGGWHDVFAAMAVGLAFAYVLGLCLALIVSCLRICVGRRGLRARSWLAVPAVAGVLAVVSIGVTLGMQVDDPPLPPENCLPFEMS